MYNQPDPRPTAGMNATEWEAVQVRRRQEDTELYSAPLSESELDEAVQTVAKIESELWYQRDLLNFC